MVDSRVRPYTCDLVAPNNNAFCDPYVKALYWAKNRIGAAKRAVAYLCNHCSIEELDPESAPAES